MDASEENDINEALLVEPAKIFVKNEPEMVEIEAVEMKVQPDTVPMETDGNAGDVVETPTSSMVFYLISLVVYK